ncbi:vancomycin resistance histidine kinase VanS [Anaeromicropila herbilytica]|uniref:vancomycin resistance histidine kinase VanS n=1 Tax=Anaeromicropila herbilytica TaxID=2785025 RepID=UPI0038CBF428
MSYSKEDQRSSTNLKKELTRRLIVRALIQIAAIITFFSITLVVGKLICAQYTWYDDESLYNILKYFEYNAPFIAIVFCFIGVIIVLLSAWRKSLGYLDNVLEATENIYHNDRELIKLPTELIEVENKMNQIKLNVRENERATKEAEQRKNDLVVYLAHDLKTPLTSVIGYLSLLRDERQISEELQEKYLTISLDKAERLEDLINEFFEITRFNLSTLTLELSRVNLTRMLEQIIYEFKPMFLEKNLQCTLHSDSNITMMFDVYKMQRVFDNLLRNAVNYSFENSTIDITIRQKENTVVIVFNNHGNTIPEEKLQRIFEQFYRLDTSRTSKSGGAGLGLAIAKEIVELHRGEILAHSENEIITFEVRIPLL